MGNRNLTLNLPEELIRKTKVRAAEEGKSMNALVREMLEAKVSGPSERAKRGIEHFLELAKKGPRSTVDVSTIRREDLYDRH